MNTPRAVLLDLDGTLANSAPGILGSYRAALRALGHEPDPDHDLTFVIGPVMADVMPQVLAHYGDDRVEEAIVLYRHFYGETGLFEASLYDGVEETLRALTAAGCRLFLATAKRLDFADRMLERFGVARYFEGIYGSVPGGALDQKSALIAHILAENDIDPAEAVMVGDRRYDITGAHANGVRAIGALWGYGDRAELEQAGADLLAGSPAELEALVTGGHVRPARDGDLVGLLSLYRSFASYDPDYDAQAAAPQWALVQASPGLMIVVAEVAGRVASSCTLAIVPNLTCGGRPWAVIENVVTHPDHRREGLGRRVLAYAVARCWDAGCYKVSLATGSKDPATLRFYEAAGFKKATKTHFEIREAFSQ